MEVRAINEYTYLFVLIFIVAVILIILRCIAGWWSRRAKCPNCKKRNAITISSKKLRTETVYFKEKEMIREYDNTQRYVKTFTGYRATKRPPSKVSTREVIIPGERTWYQVQYKCNSCGKPFSRQEYIDKRPPIVR